MRRICQFAWLLAGMWLLGGPMSAPNAEAQAKPDRGGKSQAPSQAPAKPAKPKILPGADPGGVAVAIIGTGVNYTLPAIAGRLARDGEGDLIGLDFIDRDTRPYDVAGPDTTPDGIRPLGTTLASALLGEAPHVRLVPVRIGMGEPRAFAGAAAFVASTPARIAILPFSSPNRADWEPLEQAAKTVAANVLFVVPAGDAGRDLDEQPLYPARLHLPNVLVVTTAGACGQLLPTANHGVQAVDIAVQSAPLEAAAFDGGPIKVEGSSYAAAGIARRAATILAAAGPRMTAAELKAKIVALAKPVPAVGPPQVRSGVVSWTDATVTVCTAEPNRR